MTPAVPRRALLAAPALLCGMAAPEMDLLLVLAADVSPSMDEDDRALQREGLAAAVSDPLVVAAACGGPRGAIGIAYAEWSGQLHQEQVLPWRRIASARDAAAWAAALRAVEPGLSPGGTSIVDALDFARWLLGSAPWPAARRVVDLSGDGPDNNELGLSVEAARDRAVAEGIIVNALAIEGDAEALAVLGPDATLAAYFAQRVAGGPGAFVAQAEGVADFARAIRRKLVREIAWRPDQFPPALAHGTWPRPVSERASAPARMTTSERDPL